MSTTQNYSCPGHDIFQFQRHSIKKPTTFINLSGFKIPRNQTGPRVYVPLIYFIKYFPRFINSASFHISVDHCRFSNNVSLRLRHGPKEGFGFGLIVVSQKDSYHGSTGNRVWLRHFIEQLCSFFDFASAADLPCLDIDIAVVYVPTT